MLTKIFSLKKLQLFLFVIALLSLSQSCVFPKHPVQQTTSATTVDSTIKLQFVTDQIFCPLELQSAPDSSNRLFVCQLQGKIWLMKNGKVLPTPFLDISKRMVRPDTATFDERGLYAMAFHPQFASNGKFYVYYTAPPQKHDDNCKLVVAEFHVSKNNPDIADSSSEKIIWQTESRFLAGDGCDIVFGPDGYLYISTGNIDTVKHYDEAQQLDSWLGKILRININTSPYSIPSDNPFIKVPKAKPEIWAYGFRRPWRFSFDPATHDLLAGDVGEDRLEEIDLIKKGGNYGWPIKEGNLTFDSTFNIDTTHFILPVSEYHHPIGLAVMGGYMYHGKDIPYLQNKYVFADFNGPLFFMSRKEDGNWKLQNLQVTGKPATHLSIFSMGMDGKGELYVLGDITTPKGFKGAIYKVVRD